MFRVVGFIIGYFVGCINFGYIIGRFREHIDIREYGSGNSGTTNAIRVMGWKLGTITFFGDLLKAVLAYVVVGILFDNNIYGLYAGFGAVFGHNWPVFLKFRGGKGIAATLGLIYAVDWRAGLIINVIVAIVIFTTKYVSLGSIILVTLMPVAFYFFKDGNIEYIGVGVILAVVAIYRHKANIGRLLKGNENKLGSKKKT